MKRHGFTIVELIIIITVMGILLTLGVVNLSGSQANARDAERKSDLETIAIHLETFYTSGTDGSLTLGRYPSTTELIGNEQIILRDIDTNSLKAPGVSSSSLVAAINTLQTTAGVTPSPTKDTYVYQPLKSDGLLCVSSDQDCQKFNLYYAFENGTKYIITSKNQ